MFPLVVLAQGIQLRDPLNVVLLRFFAKMLKNFYVSGSLLE